MARRRVNARVDKKVFTRSAQSHRTINLSPRTFRGGIRL